MAVVANQAVAFDKSMLAGYKRHLGDVLRPGLILDHAALGESLRSAPRLRPLYECPTIRPLVPVNTTALLGSNSLILLL